MPSAIHSRPARDSAAALSVVAVGLLFFGSVWLFKGAYFVHDIVTVMTPLEELFGRIQRVHEAPWWAPEIHGGYPLLAYGQLGYYYPPHMLLRAVLSGVWVINLSLALHTVGAALGMYVFIRSQRLAPAAAVMAAIVFAFGGAHVARFAHVGMVLPLAWLPWALWGLDRLLQAPKKYTWLIVWVGANVWQVMAGHPQSALMGLLVQLIWLGVMLRQWKNVGWLVFGSFLIAGFLTPHVLPVIDALPYTDRAQGLPAEEQFEFSAPPYALTGLVLPHPFGRGESYTGPKGEAELALYVGPVVVAVAVLGLLRVRRRRGDRLVWSGIILVVFGSILGLGEHSIVYRWLALHTPQSFFSVPTRYFLLLHTGVILLAARGLMILPARWRVAAAALSVMPVLVVAWQWEDSLPPWSAAQPPALLQAWSTSGRVWAQEQLVDAAPANDFGITVGDFIDQTRRHQQTLTSPFTQVAGFKIKVARPTRPHPGELRLTLATAEGHTLREATATADDLIDSEWTEFSFLPLEIAADQQLSVSVSSTWSRPAAPRLLIHTNPSPVDYNPTGHLSQCRGGHCEAVIVDDHTVDAAIQLVPVEQDSVPAHELLMPHVAAGFGQNSGQWTGALQLQVVAEYLAQVPHNRTLLDRLGITDLVGWAPAYRTLPGWEEGAAVPAGEGFIRAMRNPQAWPRWHFAAKVQAAHTPAEQLTALSKLTDRSAVVADILTAKSYDSAGDIVSLVDSRTKVVLVTQRATPGWLVVRDLFFPGWSVFIDGKPAALVRTDVLWRGVAVPAGHHAITFVYRPAWVIPAAVSSLSALLGTAWLIRGLFLQPRPVRQQSLERSQAISNGSAK